MISNQEILRVLNDWNIWNKDLDKGIERSDYLVRLLKLLKIENTVVKGVRRSGKSTLLRQLLYKLAEKTKKENTLFINFEDSRFAEDLSLNLIEKIYETYLEYLKPKGEKFIFLDEVQNVSGWEKWVRTKHELKEARIFVTGSSSKLLSKEFGTSLSGRYVDIDVYPLNFKEFLSFKKIEIKDNKDIVLQKTKINRLLREYLLFGGFPKIVLLDNEFEKKQQLTTYFESILLKDIVARHDLKSYEKLRKLAVFLLTNISKPHTINSLKNALNIPYDTCEKYLEYMKEAYMLFEVYDYSYSLKEQFKLPRKIYCIDSGLRNISSFLFSQDIGRVMENIIFLELKKTGNDIYYWKNKTGNEVDFVIKNGRKVEKIIQVCYDIRDPKTRKREINSLLKAGKELKCKNLFLITGDEMDEKVSGLITVPLWEWLLE